MSSNHHLHHHDAPCLVAPSPELQDRLAKDLERVRTKAKGPLAQHLALARKPRALGLDDGVIIPPEDFPLGAATSVIANAAADRAPLRGTVRVVVVLVDFSDAAMTQTAGHFSDLFFSTGVVATGSVREYYREVSNGLVDIDGDVVGPFRMPQTLAWYANGNYGIGRPTGTTRARDMAHDAAVAADPSVNFTPYDNDGNGFVDAFIVVHAGSGGEQTGNSGHIWSHKWTLPGGAYTADATKIFAYLTIPEDARLGVCAHELGHLLFGFPDLYDTDDTSEGVGNWCLMGGGSWNGGGNTPAHPSAWCKANQGWASVSPATSAGPLTIPDVKASHDVVRLWKDGAAGNEYFLLENRQRTGFDAGLPGDGLLIWHIDESQPSNTDENHYKVGLVQADGQRDLELKHNRGDAGDPYPGSSGNSSFTSTSNPNSRSYTGQETCVSVTAISASGATMTANVSVSCKSVTKDLKDLKEGSKERKDRKDRKDQAKDFKEGLKEWKDRKDGIKERKEFKEDLKEGRKEFKEWKEGGKELKEGGKDFKEFERPGGGGLPFASGGPTEPAGVQEGILGTLADLDARVSALEGALGAGGQSPEPFIGQELRPDLIGAPSYGEREDLRQRMRSADAGAKREFDGPPLA